MIKTLTITVQHTPIIIVVKEMEDGGTPTETAGGSIPKYGSSYFIYLAGKSYNWARYRNENPSSQLHISITSSIDYPQGKIIPYITMDGVI